MIDESRARELAKAALESGDDEVVLGDTVELNEGWYFPCIAKRSRVFTGHHQQRDRPGTSGHVAESHGARPRPL